MNLKAYILTLLLGTVFTFLIWSMALADEADLAWSTFLGGSDFDCAWSITLDADKCLYITGHTKSSSFPITVGVFDTAHNSGYDAFVVKLNPTGSDLDYATFLGGNGDDYGYGIVLGGAGSAYVTGFTSSSDFPTTYGAFDTTHNGDYDIFVAKLNPTGSTLDYATFLGDDSSDYGYDIALDGYGNAFVTGYTYSADFPITAGAFDTAHNSSCDAFVVKLNPTGSDLDYATFLGGNNSDCCYGIALDGPGCAYVTGKTKSYDFPVTTGAFDTTHNGCGDDAFVVKFNPTGSTLDYATFLGGNSSDFSCGIALDSLGCVHVTGGTSSLDFPTTAEAFDTTHNGNLDAFVAKFNPTASILQYASFLGGELEDMGRDIVLNGFGDIYVAGHTWSADFPFTAAAFDTTHNGGYDAFATKLNLVTSILSYSTYLGGNENDFGHAIILDGAEHIYVTGDTRSAEFPVTVGAFDETYTGKGDVFVTKLFVGDFDPVPPEAVDDLSITLSGEDLVLNWTAVTRDTDGLPMQVDFYRVYRDTVVLFNSISTLFDSTCDTFYVDTSGAVGDTKTHFYYTVTAVSGATESEYSKRVGENDKHLFILE